MAKTIKVSPIDVSRAEDFALEAADMNKEVIATIISNQVDYDTASVTLRRIKLKYNEIEDIRKSITQPLDIAKKAVMDLFRGPLETLSKAENTLKTAILTYMDMEETKRKEIEDRIRRDVEKKRQEAEAKAAALREAGKEAQAQKYEDKAAQFVAPTIAPTIEKAEGQAVKIQWTTQVVNFALLPDEYKIPNMTALNKVAQATKGSIRIPGTIFVSEKILSSRA
jgi:hypothetical protein